jgi:hypothetical protein
MFTMRCFLLVMLAFGMAVGQEGGPPQKDPNRPPCMSTLCRKIKSFLKAHYCGESPFGNGPDDGCEIREPKEHSNIKITASYDCKWTNGVRSCKQQGAPPSEMRATLISKLRGLGLPAKTKGQIYFTVWQPIGADWSLVEAYYDHISGSDVTMCQVIATVGQDSQVTILRKVRFQKADTDKNTVTTWSPLDVADIYKDGQVEIILEGDAYEDHWMEVVGMKDSSLKTVFSGLGYYL